MLYRTSILNEPNEILNFDDVYKLQKKHQKSLIEGKTKIQMIWIGQHKLCYTLGRGSNKENLTGILDFQKYNVLKIDRGGEATCHLPGQLVTYLILDLNNYNKDLDWFLRKIEYTIISILNHLNIPSSTKKGFTGVWCGNKKIASIGIGCKRWVTIHGFALNVNCDLNNFNKIIPCGIKGCLMTNISEFNPNVQIEEVKKIVKKIIKEEFNMEFVTK